MNTMEKAGLGALLLGGLAVGGYFLLNRGSSSMGAISGVPTAHDFSRLPDETKWSGLFGAAGPLMSGLLQGLFKRRDQR